MEDVPQPGSLEAEAGVFCSTFDHTGTRLITGGADKTIKVGGHFRYHDNRLQNLKRCFSRYTRSNRNDLATWPISFCPFIPIFHSVLYYRFCYRFLFERKFHFLACFIRYTRRMRQTCGTG
jgi:hypothetical protein